MAMNRNREIDVVQAAYQERNARKEAQLYPDCLYDTASIAQAAAMTPIAFFQVPVGTNGKTKAQTNMQSAGALANNDGFTIMAMRFAWTFNTHPIDVVNIAQLCYLSIKIRTYERTYGIPEMFPGGSAAYVSAATNLGTALTVTGLGPVTSTSNGICSIHNTFSFGDTGELLEANDQLEVDLFPATAFNLLATAVGGVGTTLKVFLDGYRTKKARP